MHGGPVVQWRDAPGASVTVGGHAITPVARSFVFRWPRGGAAWSRPAAVLVERAGVTRRIPVRDVNGRIRWAIRLGAAGLVAALFLRDRRRRKSND